MIVCSTFEKKKYPGMKIDYSVFGEEEKTH